MGDFLAPVALPTLWPTSAVLEKVVVVNEGVLVLVAILATRILLVVSKDGANTCLAFDNF